jgi:peptidoglycan/LPS O-acetylase OafA/YrhL
VPQVNERRAGPDGAAVPRRARRLAWALLGVTVALLAASPVIGLTGGEPWSAEFGFIPVALAFAVVGALVAARTRNRLGWLFLAAAAISAVTVAANAYAARPATAGLPGAAWVGWAFTVLLGITGSLFFLTLLLFPDGRPPSRRWWFVVWVAAVAGVAEMVTSAVSDVNFSSNFPKLTDPVTLVAPLNEAYNLETTVQVFILLAGAVSLVVRFRRSGPVERQQLKWFMYTAAVSAPVIFVVSNLVANPLPAFEIFFPLIPVAVGVAIMRYRLYDIDRIISRTLAYAIVTALLACVYAGPVLLSTQVLGLRTPVAVAIATLAAAALFNPLRRRVQRLVDRRFNRARYDAEVTVAAFAARLKDSVDLDAVRDDLAGVVTRALEPAHVSVWISRPG